MSLQRTWSSGLLAALALILCTASRAQEKVTPLSILQRAWSLEGAWTGVVSDDRNGAIYAISPGGRSVEVDLDGMKKRDITLPMSGGRTLRLATFRDGAKALLTFSQWGDDLKAYDLSGSQLWSYARASGIDDVWAGDLDGDGSDEVIVGFNGDTGLHVLNHRGQVLWKSTVIGNAWHVCAGDVLGEGTSQVVTTSADGRVHVFGSDGKKRKSLDAGLYASMVRIGKLTRQDKAATILVVGTALGSRAAQNFAILAALSGDGTRRWSLELAAGSPPHVVSADVAPGKPWLALGTRGGQVPVVDFETGQMIASVPDQGSYPEVGWAASNDADGPLLLVATRGTLNAFRVIKR